MRTDSSEEEKAILRNVLFFLRSWNPRSRISPPGIRSRRSENGILSRLGGIIENWDDQIPAVEAPRVLRAFFFHENVPRHLHIFPNVRPNTFQRAGKNRRRYVASSKRRERRVSLVCPRVAREKIPQWSGRNERDVIHPPRSVLVRADGSPDKAPCIVLLSKPGGPRFAPSDSNRNEIIVGVEP